jgi:methylated-DNA-[protein]-cysteine S-methyltransferase
MIDFALANKTRVIFTRLGWMGIQWADDRLIRLTMGHARKADVVGLWEVDEGVHPLDCGQQELVCRLKSFACGDRVDFDDVLVDISSFSAFQQRVLMQCRQLKWGETASYGTLASAVGNPGAARAVGTTMARNPIPIVIPCHRVVRSGGRHLGGFSAPGGVSLKVRMLNLESGKRQFAV